MLIEIEIKVEKIYLYYSLGDFEEGNLDMKFRG